MCSMQYFGLQIGDIEAVDPDDDWLVEAGQRYLCPVCKRRLPGQYPASVIIPKKPRNCPFNFVACARVCVVRTDLLAILEAFGNSHFHQGPLLLRTGKLLTSFRFICMQEE